MIPDHDSLRGEILSGWRLRRSAEARGFPVTTAQLDNYESWGILGDRVDGGWPHRAVERLVEARRLESEVRSLPRRVLRLRADFLRFPIDTASVQRAMVAVAPSVTNSRRKAAQIDEALSVMGRRWGQASGRRLQARVIPTPPQRSWVDLLASARPELVESRVAGWYSWANWVLPAYVDSGAPDLSDIPIEEQVLILAVRDLDADRRVAAWQRMKATNQL